MARLCSTSSVLLNLANSVVGVSLTMGQVVKLWKEITHLLHKYDVSSNSSC